MEDKKIDPLAIAKAEAAAFVKGASTLDEAVEMECSQYRTCLYRLIDGEMRSKTVGYQEAMSLGEEGWVDNPVEAAKNAAVVIPPPIAKKKTSGKGRK